MTFCVIFYRLFIVLFFVSLHNESFFVSDWKFLESIFRSFHIMYNMREKKEETSKLFALILILLSFFLYKGESNSGIGSMLFEETDTEESASSLREVSSLNDDFDRMHLESESFDEEVTNDEGDSNIWNEIKLESDDEIMEDHGLVEEVTSISEAETWSETTISKSFEAQTR